MKNATNEVYFIPIMLNRNHCCQIKSIYRQTQVPEYHARRWSEDVGNKMAKIFHLIYCLEMLHNYSVKMCVSYYYIHKWNLRYCW